MTAVPPSSPDVPPTDSGPYRISGVTEHDAGGAFGVYEVVAGAGSADDPLPGDVLDALSEDVVSRLLLDLPGAGPPRDPPSLPPEAIEPASRGRRFASSPASAEVSSVLPGPSLVGSAPDPAPTPPTAPPRTPTPRPAPPSRWPRRVHTADVDGPSQSSEPRDLLDLGRPPARHPLRDLGGRPASARAASLDGPSELSVPSDPLPAVPPPPPWLGPDHAPTLDPRPATVSATAPAEAPRPAAPGAGVFLVGALALAAALGAVALALGAAG